MIVHDAKDENSTTLIIEATLDAPRAAVWRCWSEPKLQMQWYCPKPWRVSEMDTELKPGGRANCTMEGPNGERVPNIGCYLAIDPGKSLDFTDFFEEGFVPRKEGFMVGFVRLADEPGGKTRMIWGARHANEESTKRHLEMGFREGWTAAARQLEELAQSL